MSDITINIAPAGQVSQPMSASNAESAGPPPQDALGGVQGGAGLGEQPPPSAELGGSQQGSSGAAPPPEDTMGLANGAHFTGGEPAPAPLPLEDVDRGGGTSL